VRNLASDEGDQALLSPRDSLRGEKPVQNALIERFNRTYREDILNAYLFHSTQEAQQLCDAWLVAYNEHRPHDALGRVPPLTCLPRISTSPASINLWST